VISENTKRLMRVGGTERDQPGVHYHILGHHSDERFILDDEDYAWRLVNALPQPVSFRSAFAPTTLAGVGY
jgi:hypothetical protein